MWYFLWMFLKQNSLSLSMWRGGKGFLGTKIILEVILVQEVKMDILIIPMEKSGTFFREES